MIANKVRQTGRGNIPVNFKTILVGIVLLMAFAVTFLLTSNQKTTNTDIRSRAADNQYPRTWQGRIGVRQGPDGGEFYSKSTGLKFIPRGNNYIRLGVFLDPWNGCGQQQHATFNVKRENGCDTYSYDPQTAELALTTMSQFGYNIVRVFISERLIGNKTGGLDAKYLENVVDFLKKAKAKNIYTIVTLPYLPLLGGYYVPNTQADTVSGMNWLYLSQDAITGKQKYVTDFINGLKKQNAPLDAIFSYNIENELYFEKDQKPFTLTQGTVKTGNGKTYNMNDSAGKDQLINENVVHYIDSVRNKIREIDQEAMVTAGFFHPGANTGNSGFTLTTLALADPEKGGPSSDYLDLHAYPGGMKLDELLSAFGISSNRKPYLMGEMGFHKMFASDNQVAASTLMIWQAESCRKRPIGNFTFNGFDGWALWTWDSHEQSDYHNAMDNSGNIAHALSPGYRRDPCSVSPVTVNPPPPLKTPTPTSKPKKIRSKRDNKIIEEKRL